MNASPVVGTAVKINAIIAQYDGKQVEARSFDFAKYWLSPEIKAFIEKFSKGKQTILPKKTMIRSIGYDLILGAITSSKVIDNAGQYDTAVSLMNRYDMLTVQRLYHGFLTGNERDVKTLSRPPSHETINIDGNNIEAELALLLFYICTALIDRIDYVANRLIEQQARRWLEKYRLSLGNIIRHYYRYVNRVTARSNGVIVVDDSNDTVYVTSATMRDLTEQFNEGIAVPVIPQPIVEPTPQ